VKPTPVIQAEQIIAGYDHKAIVHGVSLVIPSHKISVIIGANACGKSTHRIME
jgi:iron complex transport system ATP-binding protein